MPIKINDYSAWKETGKSLSDDSKWMDSETISEQHDYGDEGWGADREEGYGDNARNANPPHVLVPKMVKKKKIKGEGEGEDDGEPKEPKPKKVFKVGDVLVMTNMKQKKLPNDAFQYLTTFGKFEVKEVNENGNLYLGYDRISDETHKMEKYYFSPNRFDLKPEKKEEAEDQWWLK